MSDLKTRIHEIGARAKAAAGQLAVASTASKNAALVAMAKAIRANESAILAANAKDMAEAKAAGISGAMLDRLELNEKRVEAMAKGVEEIALLPDPVGRELARWKRKENGLDIARVAVPLGVIGIIYESRPNVTADAGALCLKAGNAAILRGGSESFHSSSAILECLQAGLKSAGLPAHTIQSIPTKDRAAVGEMLKLSEYIDVIIPRGGKGLIKRVIEESRIPTLQHLDGNCHTYIHTDAAPEKAVNITLNAKMRRTGVCGATESLVLDEAVVDKLLPRIADTLIAAGCEMRGDERARKADPRLNQATREDFITEYLDAILSVKVVKNVEEAITFINAHGSGHTDAIITENAAAAEKFLNEIGSAIAMHNTSTQFADGGEFGMGAEIGIATGKLHARGPVGVEQLCTFKYVVRSVGSVRA